MEFPSGWMQGRSVFGGFTAAAAVAAAHRHVDDHRQLRSLNIQFLRPCVPGSVVAECALLRQGKTASFVQVNLRQETSLVSVLHLVFAALDSRRTEVVPNPSPLTIDPATLSDLPYVEGLTPEFTQHFAFRWASGGYPFSGSEEARFAGFIQPRGIVGDIEGVIALLDAWPCPTLSVLSAPAFASSVAWTAHVHRVPTSFSGWFAFEYETVMGAGGFHTIVGRLYGPDGSLVGWTEQLAAVFG